MMVMSVTLFCEKQQSRDIVIVFKSKKDASRLKTKFEIIQQSKCYFVIGKFTELEWTIVALL